MNELKGIDIYRVSDNSLCLVRSNYLPQTNEKFIDALNDEAKRAGLKTRFVWIPNEMNFEQFRRG